MPYNIGTDFFPLSALSSGGAKKELLGISNNLRDAIVPEIQGPV